MEGRFLQLIVSLSGFRDVVDIGTFTGYSALAMAESVPPDGRVLTRLLIHYGRDINEMKLSDWLDEKEAEDVDVSQIELPADISFDSVPDETVYFKEDNPCGVLCTKHHPFAKVERYGHWFYCTGRDKKAGIHSTAMKWRLFTKDLDLALRTAKNHME